MKNYNDIFELIYRLDLSHETDDALVMLFDVADEAFTAGEFKTFNSIFQYFMPSFISRTLGVGILSATYPAKDELDKLSGFDDLDVKFTRKDFIEEFKAELRQDLQTEEYINELLKGLM